MQLAATRGGKWEWLFGLFASVPASGASRIHKSRLQPCEPKPRPAEARRHSLRWLRHENNTAPTEAELANLQPALFLNEANAACGAASPATTEVTIHRAGRLRPAQHCELQNRRTAKTGSRTTQFHELQKTAEQQKPTIKQRNSTNYKTGKNRRSNNRKQNNYSLSTHLRHYAASGLLNLQTTLTRAVTLVTQGVKLPFQR